MLRSRVLRSTPRLHGFDEVAIRKEIISFGRKQKQHYLYGDFKNKTAIVDHLIQFATDPDYDPEDVEYVFFNAEEVEHVKDFVAHIRASACFGLGFEGQINETPKISEIAH